MSDLLLLSNLLSILLKCLILLHPQSLPIFFNLRISLAKASGTSQLQKMSQSCLTMSTLANLQVANQFSATKTEIIHSLPIRLHQNLQYNSWSLQEKVTLPYHHQSLKSCVFSKLFDHLTVIRQIPSR